MAEPLVSGAGDAEFWVRTWAGQKGQANATRIPAKTTPTPKTSPGTGEKGFLWNPSWRVGMGRAGHGGPDG